MCDRTSRIEWTLHFFSTAIQEIGINHGLYIFMPEQFLHRASTLDFIGNKRDKMPSKPCAAETSAHFKPVAETLV